MTKLITFADDHNGNLIFLVTFKIKHFYRTEPEYTRTEELLLENGRGGTLFGN